MSLHEIRSGDVWRAKINGTLYAVYSYNADNGIVKYYSVEDQALDVYGRTEVSYVHLMKEDFFREKFEHVGPGGEEPISEERYTSDEIRVTDPVTGGQKGQKLSQLGAIDPQSIMEIAKVAGFGAQKYERMNFMRGYAWSLSYDAMQRHLHAFWNGEETDPESGLPHLAHAAWHCCALLSFAQRNLGTDDRYKEK